MHRRYAQCFSSRMMGAETPGFQHPLRRILPTSWSAFFSRASDRRCKNIDVCDCKIGRCSKLIDREIHAMYGLGRRAMGISIWIGTCLKQQRGSRRDRQCGNLCQLSQQLISMPAASGARGLGAPSPWSATCVSLQRMHPLVHALRDTIGTPLDN